MTPLGRDDREAMDILRQVPDIYQENGMWYANSAKSGHIAALIVHQNTKGRGGIRRPFPPRRNSTAFDHTDYARFRTRQSRPYELPPRREQRTYNDRDREPSDNRPNYASPSSSRGPLADRSNDRSTQRQMSPPKNNSRSHASSSSASVDRFRAPSTRMDHSQPTSTPLNRYTHIHCSYSAIFYLYLTVVFTVIKYRIDARTPMQTILQDDKMLSTRPTRTSINEKMRNRR